MTRDQLDRRHSTAPSRRWAIAMVLALAVTSVMPGAVAARQTGKKGTIGPYSHIDTKASPAGLCFYGAAAGSYYLEGIRVRSPRIYWPGKDPRRSDEHGTVGWRIVVQVKRGGKWRTFKRSAITKGIAYEHQVATIKRRKVEFTRHAGDTYRAVGRIFWYRPNGTQLGRANILIEHYDALDQLGRDKVRRDCIGRVMNGPH